MMNQLLLLVYNGDSKTAAIAETIIRVLLEKRNVKHITVVSAGIIHNKFHETPLTPYLLESAGVIVCMDEDSRKDIRIKGVEGEKTVIRFPEDSIKSDETFIRSCETILDSLLFTD